MVRLYGMLCTADGTPAVGSLCVGSAGAVSDEDGSAIITGTVTVDTEDTGYFEVEVVRPVDGIVPLAITGKDGRVLVQGHVQVEKGVTEVNLSGCLSEVATYNGRPAYVQVVVPEPPATETYDHTPLEEHVAERSLSEFSVPLFAFISSWVTAGAGETVSVQCYPHTHFDTVKYGSTAFALSSRVQSRGSDGAALSQSDVSATVVNVTPQAITVSCTNRDEEPRQVRVVVLATAYTRVFQ